MSSDESIKPETMFFLPLKKRVMHLISPILLIVTSILGIISAHLIYVPDLPAYRFYIPERVENSIYALGLMWTWSAMLVVSIVLLVFVIILSLKPAVILSESGIEIQLLTKKPIPWSEIESIEHKSYSTIRLTVKNLPDYSAWRQRIYNKFAKTEGPNPYIFIHLTGMNSLHSDSVINPASVVVAIRRYWEAAHDN